MDIPLRLRVGCLRRSLLILADRGYPSLAYFEAVGAHGGSCIMRLTRRYDPWVRRAWRAGRRVARPVRRRLAWWLARHPGRRLDLDVADATAFSGASARDSRSCNRLK